MLDNVERGGLIFLYSGNLELELHLLCVSELLEVRSHRLVHRRRAASQDLEYNKEKPRYLGEAIQIGVSWKMTTCAFL